MKKPNYAELQGRLCKNTQEIMETMGESFGRWNAMDAIEIIKQEENERFYNSAEYSKLEELQGNAEQTLDLIESNLKAIEFEFARKAPRKDLLNMIEDLRRAVYKAGNDDESDSNDLSELYWKWNMSNNGR